MSKPNANIDPARSAAEAPGFARHGLAAPKPYRCTFCRLDAIYHMPRGGWLCAIHHQELMAVRNDKAP